MEPFPAGGMAGLPANRVKQRIGRETATGNESELSGANSKPKTGGHVTWTFTKARK
jgi:hypothetical protein